jgi:hypothetical protein
LEEFFNQGDLEKEMGLPFIPLNDRHQTTKPKAQIGYFPLVNARFIEFVLLPVFNALNAILPNIETNFVSPIKSSLGYYKRVQQQQLAQQQQQQQQATTQ